MSARWWTLGVWALAAASALFWGLKLFVMPPAAPPQTQLAEPGAGLRGDLTRLLGVDPPAPLVAAAAEAAPDARFTLVGVLSPRSPQAAREGVALIAVDGRIAKAYRVGAVVDGQNVLQSVGARSATLGPQGGASLIALNITPQPPASTGTLPAAAVDGGVPPAPVRGAARPPTPTVAPRIPVLTPPLPPGATAQRSGLAPPPRANQLPLD